MKYAKPGAMPPVLHIFVDKTVTVVGFILETR
jgi:hypothetical protein